METHTIDETDWIRYVIKPSWWEPSRVTSMLAARATLVCWQASANHAPPIKSVTLAISGIELAVPKRHLIAANKPIGMALFIHALCDKLEQLGQPTETTNCTDCKAGHVCSKPCADLHALCVFAYAFKDWAMSEEQCGGKLFDVMMNAWDEVPESVVPE
jgi:hypothetical protein